jgi:chemotaxis protein MotB
MARKHKHPEHVNHERWLISYADFITLLFAFFVVMFAASQTDKAKARQISEAVKNAIEKGGVPAVVHEILGGTVDDKGKGNAQMKGPGGAQKQTPPIKDQIVPEAQVAITELMPSMQYLNQALANEIKAGKVEVKLEARGLVVSLRQAAFFPSAGDEFSAAGMESLNKIANAIKDVSNPVRLEGHTDSQPIHTERFASNWELSVARSIAMLKLLTEKYHLPDSRFSVAGYAETKPIESNETVEGRAHNRRVDIVILNQTVVVKQGGVGAEPKGSPAAKH